MQQPHPTKGRILPVEPLSTAEVRALLGRCSQRSPTGLRNAALIVVLWRTGLRCSEAVSLRRRDVDAQAGSLRVLRGKGGRGRTVGIDGEALSVLGRWLDRQAQKAPDAYIFATLDGRGPLCPSYVRAYLRRYGKEAGIAKRVHPHGLRHTHANELAEEGVPMPVIQAQLGHRNLATTAIYLQRVGSTAAVIEAISARPGAGIAEVGQ